MVSKIEVMNTDEFLALPAGTQALYFHLFLRVDEDKVLFNPKAITRMVGAAPEELERLMGAGLVYPDEAVPGGWAVAYWSSLGEAVERGSEKTWQSGECSASM